MAVGNVVHDLPDGPAALAVGRVELRVGEVLHGVAQGGGQGGHGAAGLVPLRGREGLHQGHRAEGVAGVGQGRVSGRAGEVTGQG